MCFLYHFSSSGFALIPVFSLTILSKRAKQENFRTAEEKHPPGRKRQKKIKRNEIIDIA